MQRKLHDITNAKRQHVAKVRSDRMRQRLQTVKFLVAKKSKIVAASTGRSTCKHLHSWPSILVSNVDAALVVIDLFAETAEMFGAKFGVEAIVKHGCNMQVVYHVG